MLSTAVTSFVMQVQANIKVHGSNGRCQMLKLWLPGLLQLGGDHVRKELASEIQIEGLLDVRTGLRNSA